MSRRGRRSRGPVVVITGASRGIGRALAEHFLGRGATVIGCSRHPTPVRPRRAGYHHVCLDISDEPAVQGLMREVRMQHGRLDILVNNAGVASMNHFMLTPLLTVRRLLDVNVAGTFVCSREAAKLMQERRFGRIVNVSSVAVPLQVEGEAAYVASKGAVEALTRVLARELAPFNITCNAVAPAPIDTDMTRGVPAAKLRRLVERLAIKRMCTFEDVVNVIDFFVRPESSYITGQVIYLGGV